MVHSEQIEFLITSALAFLQFLVAFGLSVVAAPASVHWAGPNAVVECSVTRSYAYFVRSKFIGVISKTNRHQHRR